MRAPLLLSTVFLSLAALATAQHAPRTSKAPHSAAPQSERSVQLTELDITVIDRRVLQADGRVLRHTTLPDGTHVDLDALRAEDHALGLSRRGKLTPALSAAVDALAPDERIQVAFWLTEPADGRDLGAELRARVRGVDSEDMRVALDAARTLNMAAAAERYAAPNRAFADVVELLGGEVVHEGEFWPLLIAELNESSLRELANDPRVDEVYLSQREWMHEGDNAQGTLRTPFVWDQGVTVGGGVRVLVNDTAQVQVGNSFLPAVIALNSSGTGSHATGVAGNIANFHPTYQAAAHTLDKLYTAGGSGDTNAPIIWGDAIAQGIDFGNCSWWNGLKGSIAFLDRFFDHTIRNHGVMMFKSNGNQGSTSSPYGTTPGQGYNMTCSGAYLDQDNIGWESDEMSSTSSYWDPLEGHTKPEIASPGTCVTTTGTGGTGLQTCFGGTSSASPLTTGLATLLAGGEPQLLAEMTSVKAILMASAWHNIEGDALLSEKDGVGGLHAPAAWAIVRDEQWWHDEVVDADFAGGTLDIDMPLLAGEETRVVALWFSNPNDALSTDVLELDVDMSILDPDGLPVASSMSAANPFEIASFVSAKSGTYTVRLSKQRFDGDSEPLSVAWSTRNDTSTARIGLAPFSDDFAAGNTVIFQLHEEFEGPGRLYFAWASLSGKPGIALPDGLTGFPVALDMVGNFIVNEPGFIGFLDGAGSATFGLQLPNGPAIVGLELHMGAAILGPSTMVSDVYTIADEVVLTVAP
ncbi:MAG: hypothetical protein DHS20C15_32950 [Planctomycetota bacterium]|nr:MAG: hypothetical protein DHS20C15_32950 [Planctomycetota bacterium]